jgi:hypothetical protein
VADPFFRLSAKDQLDALGVASAKSGRPVHLLEKDVWVVWALEAMRSAQFGRHLVFKGGTSLSKVYRAINRFSEDVDLTYDIRAFVPALASGEEPLPPSRSQEKVWTKQIRESLTAWVSTAAKGAAQMAAAQQRVSAQVSVHPNDSHTLQITYEPLAMGTGYGRPAVLLEFGARSTGEPSEQHTVRCDAAEYLPEVQFPTTSVRAMRIERTFWEKATAIHVFCLGGRVRGDSRFSRHWYDVAQLDAKGHVASALKAREIATRVADHKTMFFVEKGERGAVIDYRAAVSGALRLVPKGARKAALAEDYGKMIADGLLLEKAPTFGTIIRACEGIEARANTRFH